MLFFDVDLFSPCFDMESPIVEIFPTKILLCPCMGKYSIKGKIS